MADGRDMAKRLPFVRLGAAALRRLWNSLPHRPQPVILMYHRIAEDSFDPWGLAVSPENFKDQLQWLAEHRTVLPLIEFASLHRDGSLPDNAIAITFDDGYACFAKTAAPLLESFRMPATVFLPVELVERGAPFWWDELQAIVVGSTSEMLRIDSRFVPLGDKSDRDARWNPGSPPSTPRQTAFHRIWALLRPKAPAEIDAVLADLRSLVTDSGTDLGSKRPMTPQQVRAVAKGDIEFGSHALTHPWLASLDLAEKRREIFESADRIGAIVGRRPATFAYPYGNSDEKSEELVAEAGFLCACSTEPRRVKPETHLFALPRIGVGNWNGRQFGRVIAGAPA